MTERALCRGPACHSALSGAVVTLAHRRLVAFFAVVAQGLASALVSAGGAPSSVPTRPGAGGDQGGIGARRDHKAVPEVVAQQRRYTFWSVRSTTRMPNLRS